MTEAQNEAITKISEILSEHFEASVLIVQHDPADDRSNVEAYWHGGYVSARGLIELGLEDMKDTCDSDE